MSKDKPSLTELRARVQFIDDGLELHQQTRRMWLVTKPYKLFCKDWSMPAELVLARNAVEARKLVREKHYKIPGHNVPQELEAVEVDISASRILDTYNEEIRAQMAQKENRETG